MNIFLTFVLKSKLGLKEEGRDKKERISLTLSGFLFQNLWGESRVL